MTFSPLSRPLKQPNWTQKSGKKSKMGTVFDHFLTIFGWIFNFLKYIGKRLWAFKNMLNGHENIWNFKYLVFLAFWVIFSAGGKGIWAYYLRYQISPKMPNGHENAWFLAKMQTQCPFKCLNQLAWRSQNILFLLFLTLLVSICKKFALQHLENSRSHLSLR